jgi:hypothetical protein
MKKTVALAITMATTLMLAGCAPMDSLQSLYTPDDKIFEEGLLGTWQPKAPESDEDKNSRWIFERSGDENSYAVSLTSVDKKGRLLAKARLVRLGNTLFVDFMGDMDDDRWSSGTGVAPYPVIPTHMIGRIWIDRDSFRIRLLDDQWVKKQIKSGKFALPYIEVEAEQILTAKTEELRKFALAYAEDQDAFSNNLEFIRAK